MEQVPAARRYVTARVRTDARHTDDAGRAARLQSPAQSIGANHEKAGHAAGSTE